MHPPLPNAKQAVPNKTVSPLTAQIQRSLEEVLERVIEIEKDEYHNDLVPFSQHEKQIREKGQLVIQDLTGALEQGQKVLKDFFELEEKNHLEIDPESHYARWEEASQKLIGMPSLLEVLAHSEEAEELPLQQQCGLSWAFMDRAYALAKKLQDDKRLDDAVTVFKFLRYVNARVFEYWLGEAGVLFQLGKFEEALESYSRSVLLQPKNPYVFYQIGTCCYKLGDIESSESAFDLCIEVAKNDENNKGFVQMATEAKQFLSSKKAA